MVATLAKSIHLVAEREDAKSSLEVADIAAVVIAVVPCIHRSSARCKLRLKLIDVDG